MLELVDEKIRKHPFWKYGVVVFGIILSAATWWQMSRQEAAASIEQERAIERVASETSQRVTKTVSQEYQAMITDLTSQIQSLKQQLIAQAKDVGVIKQSPIVTGKNPIKVEVTNGLAATGESEDEKENREAIRTKLGQELSTGKIIMNACVAQPPVPNFSCRDKMSTWYAETLDYIRKNLEPSYGSRFETASTPSMSWTGADEQTNNIMNFLNARTQALDQFIRELLN